MELVALHERISDREQGDQRGIAVTPAKDAVSRVRIIGATDNRRPAPSRPSRRGYRGFSEGSRRGPRPRSTTDRSSWTTLLQELRAQGRARVLHEVGEERELAQVEADGVAVDHRLSRATGSSRGARASTSVRPSRAGRAPAHAGEELAEVETASRVSSAPVEPPRIFSPPRSAGQHEIGVFTAVAQARHTRPHPCQGASSRARPRRTRRPRFCSSAHAVANLIDGMPFLRERAHEEARDPFGLSSTTRLPRHRALPARAGNRYTAERRMKNSSHTAGLPRASWVGVHASLDPKNCWSLPCSRPHAEAGERRPGPAHAVPGSLGRALRRERPTSASKPAAPPPPGATRSRRHVTFDKRLVAHRSRRRSRMSRVGRPQRRREEGRRPRDHLRAGRRERAGAGDPGEETARALAERNAERARTLSKRAAPAQADSPS